MTDEDDRYLRIPAVAGWTGFSENTLRAWRQRKVGPPSYKVGGSVVYRESEVREWLRAQLEASTAAGA